MKYLLKSTESFSHKYNRSRHIVYYLWKSCDNRDKYYITDYNEQKPGGLVWIDGEGLVRCSLEFQHTVKEKCWDFARDQFVLDVNNSIKFENR